MNISVEKVADIMMVVPRPAQAAQAATRLETVMAAHMERGERRFVLDLSEIDDLAAADVRTVLMYTRRLRQEGGALLVCHLSETATQTIERIGVSALIDVAPTRAAAVAALA